MTRYSILQQKKNKLVSDFFGNIEKNMWEDADWQLNDQFTFFLNQSGFLSRDEFINLGRRISSIAPDLKIKITDLYEEDELVKGRISLVSNSGKSLFPGLLSKKRTASPARFEIWIEENKILALVIKEE